MADSATSSAAPDAKEMSAPKFSPAFKEAFDRWKEAYRAYADDEDDSPDINAEEQAAEDALMAVPATTAEEMAAKLCVFTRWGDFVLSNKSPLMLEAIRLSGLPPYEI